MTIPPVPAGYVQLPVVHLSPDFQTINTPADVPRDQLLFLQLHPNSSPPTPLDVTVVGTRNATYWQYGYVFYYDKTQTPSLLLVADITPGDQEGLKIPCPVLVCGRPEIYVGVMWGHAKGRGPSRQGGWQRDMSAWPPTARSLDAHIYSDDANRDEDFNDLLLDFAWQV